VTEVTYTSTITNAPAGAVTVVKGEDGVQYTYGAETVYKIFIYTTTQEIDLVSFSTQCNKKKRSATFPQPTAKFVGPAYVEATPTPSY
jgi:hypothetical protein